LVRRWISVSKASTTRMTSRASAADGADLAGADSAGIRSHASVAASQARLAIM
jgi:hypothetical protein